jgi:hypothetical protein
MNHLICLRCGHIFNNKANLNKHYQRIYPCPNQYYEYNYIYLRNNHKELKEKRIELIVFMYKAERKIKTPKPRFKIDEKPSHIMHDKIKTKITELDSSEIYKEIYIKIHKCDCGKIFNHHSSLSRHKKTKHPRKETLLYTLIKGRDKN